MSRRAARLLVVVLVVLGVTVADAGAPTPVTAPAAAETFGSTPLDDVLYWADQKKSCGLTRDELAAMVLAPTFPETGATGTLSPSPMTLSRYDTSKGLYAFSNPSTAYPQAFWHPGVGAWQFDSSGGWNLTAAGAINTWTAAQQATTLIASRYCTGKTRTYAWGPWYACASSTCEAIFDRIYDGSKLVGVNRDLGVTREGGMVERTCSMVGVVGTFPCWHVDPAKAQGVSTWRLPAFGKSPITKPFYVFDRDGREQRHWLRADTGYAVGIRADKPVTANARTSLVWAEGEVLCDVTTGRGACSSPPPPPPLPPPLTAVPLDLRGPWTPLVGDFDGNGHTDVFLYAPGAAPDLLAKGSATGFTYASAAVQGTYWPQVGDFNGDGGDDIYWYGVGPAYDSMWFGTGFGFLMTPIAADASLWPVIADIDGDGRDDIHWISPGSAADLQWFGRSDRSFTWAVSTRYAPGSAITGDFDGDGRGDLLWHTADSAADTIWFGRADRGYDVRSSGVAGTFSPLVADFDGDGRDDVLWYQPGTGADWFWWGAADRAMPATAVTLNGVYDTITATDLDGNGVDDLVLYRRSSAVDYVSFGTGDRALHLVQMSVSGDHQLLRGDFTGSAAGDVLWVDLGAPADALWTVG